MDRDSDEIAAMSSSPSGELLLRKPPQGYCSAFFVGVNAASLGVCEALLDSLMLLLVAPPPPSDPGVHPLKLVIYPPSEGILSGTLPQGSGKLVQCFLFVGGIQLLDGFFQFFEYFRRVLRWRKFGEGTMSRE